MLEKPQAISVKLTVLTLIKAINLVEKHSIRDLFHEKNHQLIDVHDSMSFLAGKNMDYQ